ncbi:MAG TPA: VWA domain-containing protein, partial [Thermodesulfobacteriota bacterium]|nr:VWA domain-containing protein [Thermodesulfobacteriota bacterium]
MAFNFLPATFHFSEPFWLWGMAALPLIWMLYLSFFERSARNAGNLKDFADEHLLPHLLAQEEKSGGKSRNIWLPLTAWSFIWTFGLLAMAGPRWGFTEVKTFTPGRDLVILLDLSKSMDAQDVKPSRTARARQEIEDIVKASKGTNIGLIAFATVPHMITPLSDDTQTLSSLLPYLKPDLVYTQGSYLSPALETAGEMLKPASGNDKYVFIISDGGFDDGDASILKAEESLRSQGATIDVMGMGTPEGSPVPDARGGYIRKNGSLVFSRLEEDRLKRIAHDGGGIYLTASYLGDDTQSLLSEIETAASANHEAKKTTRFWEERYYIFLIPFALLLLPWFRRNAVFPVILAAFIAMHISQAQAFDWDSLYLNDNQQGAKYLQEGKYDNAVDKFDDPYRQGVAEYKAGKYEAAARSFEKADRPGIKTDALYNLGNAQLMSGKIEDAIKSYEDVLKTDPDHADAKYNLEIAKKLLEQKQQNQQQK